MSTREIEDYLTKQLFISKNIVTYRSLSREFGIHVNKAKNELATFHTKVAQSRGQTCSATYLISGEVACAPSLLKVQSQSNGGSSMDMDLDIYAVTPTYNPTPDFGFANGSEQDEGEAVLHVKLTVVSETGLEDAKAKYTKITSTHVYSLSPAPIRDADLLCEPTRRVREIDNSKGAEMAKAVGRIVGQGIEMLPIGTKAKARSLATTSGQTTAGAQKLKSGPSVTSAATTSVKTEDTAKEPAKDEPKKSKQTGKLNFFTPAAQAQTKEKGKESSSKSSAVTQNKMFFGAGPSSKSNLQSSAKQNVTAAAPPPALKGEEHNALESAKRGTKRKSTAAILSSDEEDQESAKSNSAAPSGAPSRQSSNPPSNRSSPQPISAISKLRLHKGTVLSDEDDDDEQPRKRIVKKARRKETHISDDENVYNPEATKEATRALKSMMEIADDYVEKVSRKVRVEAIRQEEEEETEPEQTTPLPANRDGDVDMSDDTEVKPKRKTRKKAKKIVPLGRNGLKKRRIMKSRTRCDEKGYMVTEDYSSYESVEEEEEEEEPKKAAATKKGTSGKSTTGGKREKEEGTESAAPEDTAANAATTNSDLKPKGSAKATSSSNTKPPANKSTAKGGQKQKTLNTFFGVPKPRK